MTKYRTNKEKKAGKGSIRAKLLWLCEMKIIPTDIKVGDHCYSTEKDKGGAH